MSTEEVISRYVNTGDYTVYDSSLKLLSYSDLSVANMTTVTKEDIDKYNSEYDYCFLRGSNFINEKMEWHNAPTLLRGLKIPVIGFAVGAQAATQRKLNLPAKSIDFWRLLADHSASIGVRGSYTAEVLNDLGITNIDVIGCPSLFRMNNPDLNIQPKPLDQVKRVAFNLRREGGTTYSSDVARYLTTQKRLIRDLNQRFNLTVTVHGEREEKAYYFGREDAISEAEEKFLRSGWFESKDDPLIGIYRRRLFFSRVVKEHDDLLQSMDFVTGFRVHGNLPALANGVPALLFDYDQRSHELGESLAIPSATYQDVDGKTVEEIYNSLDFTHFNNIYPSNYRRMATFLEKNGMPHLMTPVAAA